MRRRLYAASTLMTCAVEKLRPHVAFAETPSDIVIAKADSRTKTVVRTPMVEAIVATILQNGFDIVIIDPFAETFEGDENSNSELKWAAVLWREIARRTNAAVLLVHHTKKYGAEAGSIDAARGGSALVGVARIVSTLFTMTEQEATSFNVDSEKRHDTCVSTTPRPTCRS
jgi:RecA-family ATPase